MADVYVVYGRKQWPNITCVLDQVNPFSESAIFGVFSSFNAALEEFKKCVARGCRNFLLGGYAFFYQP